MRNAFAAYEQLSQWQATNETHLLAAHERMMFGLMDNAGRWRNSGVGIFQEQALIHIAPPASQIPRLMADLLNWLATTDYHPLISSCVFHNVSSRTIERYLKKLQQQGVLKRVGSAKSGHWQVEV